MKRSVLAAAMLTLAAAMGSAADAAILSDSFDYPAGTQLVGQASPGGKVWANAGAGAANLSVVAGLTAPAGLPAASGNAIQFGSNGGVASGAAGRIEVGNVTSGSLYWSLLLRVDDVNGAITGNTGAYIAGFNSNIDAQTTNLSTAVSRLVIRLDANDPTKFNFGTSVNSNDGSATGPQKWDATPRSAGDTFLLVGRYTFNPSTKDDVAELWINPDAATFGTDAAPAANLSSVGADIAGGAIKSFFLRQNTNAPGSVTADELRVDTTWAGVTSSAVPEPATAAVAFASLLGMVGRFPRRA